MAFDLKPLQALNLWQQVTLDGVRRDAPDLSARQMAILLSVYLTPPPHTVRGLASSTSRSPRSRARLIRSAVSIS